MSLGGRLVFAAAMLLGTLPSVSPAQTGGAPVVYDPTPDDLDDVVVPPVVNVPDPVSAPITLPTGATEQSREQVKRDAKELGKSVGKIYEALPLSDNAASVVPGYNGQTPEHVDLYSNPDQIESRGVSAASTSEGFRTVTDPNRTRVVVPRDQLERALEIEADPRSFLQGETLDGSHGTCKELPPGAGTAEMAEFTCNVGQSVADRNVKCPVTWDHHFSSSYNYSCTSVSMRERVCVEDFGSCTKWETWNREVGSGCDSFQAAGCQLTSSTSKYVGVGNISGLGYAGPIWVGENSYSCGAAVTPLITGSGAVLKPSGETVLPTFEQLSGSTVYVDSTLNISQCEAAENLTCPEGYTLEGSSCVSRRPADIVYACEDGWTLRGDQCVSNSAIPATPSGYSCPADYVPDGTMCVSTKPATIVGYNCPSGYDLQGTMCVMVETQAPDITGYTCPADYTKVGSQCSKVEEVAGTPSFSCEPGWTLSGETCSIEEREPATTSYSCSPGWVLQNGMCVTTVTQPAVPTGVGCEPGWTASGGMCVRTTTISATPNYSCEAGWSLQGNLCVRQSSQPATPSYTCPAGTTLSGTNCIATSSVPATQVYSCQAGWSLVGNVCQMTQSRPADVVYSCNSGWTLQGNVCRQSAGSAWPAPPYICTGGSTLFNSVCFYSPATTGCAATLDGMALNRALYGPRGQFLGCEYTPLPNPNQCMPGYEFDPTVGMCILYVTENAIQSWKCGSNETLDGTVCTEIKTVSATPSYTCPTGHELNGTMCVSGSSQPATVVYQCPAGWAESGGQCTKTEAVPANTSYICPYGYTQNGSSCSITESIPGALIYSCPTGFDLNGTTCTRIDTRPPNTENGCPAGWSVDGTMCVRSRSNPAAVVYSCPTGYSVRGNMCERTVLIAPDPVYACAPGYTLDGGLCKITRSMAANPEYSCPENSLLQGSVCRTTLEATVAGYSCPTGYTLQGKYCSLEEAKPAIASQVCAAGFALENGQCVDLQTPGVGSASCSSPVDTCTDSSPVTRVINGVSITKPCWAWERTYGCTDVNQGQNDCGELESNVSCKFDHELCLDDEPSADGSCNVKERVYLCPNGKTVSDAKQYVCGDDVYCINGDCESIEREPSTEFKDAVTAMNVLGQVNSEFDEQSLTLFKGERLTCHKKLFGLSNCCTGKGVPIVTPFLCSAAERDLDTRDDKGLCHKVGTYCSDKVLGICVTKKDAYCCFASKLSRILQEQGRKQINKPWGKPKDEKCVGFTLDEFSRVDLSTMDFSEVYAEFTDAVKLPSEVDLTVQIKERIQQYYSTHGGN